MSEKQNKSVMAWYTDKDKIKIIKTITRIVTITKTKIITKEIITVNNFIFQIIRDVKLSGYSFYKLFYI